MSGNLLTDWAILAISLFNAILLAWLGLTVLLNSDRRRWGIWVAGGGMLLGAAFFTSHTALLGLGLLNLGWDTLIFWWSVGLLSAIALPFLWYVIMLWYAGFWEDADSDLRRRHKPWLLITLVILVVGIVGIISAAVSLGIESPRFGSWFMFLRHSGSGTLLLVLGFSFYMLMSILLSLDALRKPGPSARVMGRLARRRARPWLAGASVALFFVAVIVAATLFWVGQQSQQVLLSEVYLSMGPLLAFLDLIVSALIGLVIIFLGQAIVAYEIFTGKSLPRRGLSRQWGWALILAGSISGLTAAAVTLAIRSIYGLLLAALLMTLFFVLVSWRSYVERERLIRNLRPFVASQGLYERLLKPMETVEIDLKAPFNALCRDVLDAKRAYLAALGAMAALVEKPLIYPYGADMRLPDLQALLQQFNGARLEPLPIDPGQYGGAVWAVPLWGDSGLTGVLLLGEKRGKGLYTQEEMEIAAVTGERLIDTLAGAELSQRLMRLQREHMAQTQVVDQQTRRVLHDEILPDLHAAMIGLSRGQNNDAGTYEELLALLSGTHRQISDLLHELPAASSPEVERLGLLPALRRTVEVDYSPSFDVVRWVVDESLADRVQSLPDMGASVIYYAAREAVRNAAKYGRAAAADKPFVLTLRARIPNAQEHLLAQENQELQIIIEDNGRGLPVKDAGQQNGGQGLALHSTLMAVISGTLAVSSSAGDFTRVTLAFPG